MKVSSDGSPGSGPWALPFILVLGLVVGGLIYIQIAWWDRLDGQARSHAKALGFLLFFGAFGLGTYGSRWLHKRKGT